MFRRTFLAAVAAGVSSSGCAALAKWLPVVISTLVEAAEVLDNIDGVAKAYFAVSPDAEKEKTYNQIMAKARSGLALAANAAKGTDAASKQKVDKALAAFKLVYQDLLALLGPLGVVSPAPDGAPMSAPDGEGPLLVPTGDDLIARAKVELAR